jgi:hypothetical protein
VSAVKHPADARTRLRPSGARLVEWNAHSDSGRYPWDSRLLAAGWRQWDTDQDAWYFGVWVHKQLREVFTYAEGDCVHVLCSDAASFRAELSALLEAHPEHPPAIIEYDLDARTRTEVRDHRLSPEDIDDEV